MQLSPDIIAALAMFVTAATGALKFGRPLLFALTQLVQTFAKMELHASATLNEMKGFRSDLNEHGERIGRIETILTIRRDLAITPQITAPPVSENNVSHS